MAGKKIKWLYAFYGLSRESWLKEDSFRTPDFGFSISIGIGIGYGSVRGGLLGSAADLERVCQSGSRHLEPLDNTSIERICSGDGTRPPIQMGSGVGASVVGYIDTYIHRWYIIQFPFSVPAIVQFSPGKNCTILVDFILYMILSLIFSYINIYINFFFFAFCIDLNLILVFGWFWFATYPLLSVFCY